MHRASKSDSFSHGSVHGDSFDHFSLMRLCQDWKGQARLITRCNLSVRIRESKVEANIAYRLTDSSWLNGQVYAAFDLWLSQQYHCDT